MLVLAVLFRQLVELALGVLRVLTPLADLGEELALCLERGASWESVGEPQRDFGERAERQGDQKSVV